MNRIKKLFDLSDKVAVVTGASKGIGESIARGFAEFGAQVVVSSRKQDAVDEVAANFNNEGLKAVGVACHVARQDDREELIKHVIERFGKIDILVNNAGTNPYFGPIENMPSEAYHKTMEINLIGPMELSKLAMQHMKETGGGSIIHISSIEGLHASSGFAAYNLSKSGLIMLTQNQAVEWGRYNIRVNAICPGLVKTKLSRAIWDNPQQEKIVNRIPLNRMALPDEMSGLAVLLASNASSYMTGSIILNDGGIIHAPLITL